MPQPRRIPAPAFVPDVIFMVRDASGDVDRQYKPAIKTRTRKRDAAAAWTNLIDLEQTIAEQTGPRTEKQEEKAVKAACDLIDLLIVNVADGVPAGEMLYRDWLAELTPEDYIADTLAQVMGVEEAPNPTQTGA